MQKRSQAGLDLLVTHGWAFFVILAAIGSLAYFGVSPSRTTPERCTFQPEFQCLDYQLSSDSLKLRIKNNAGKAIGVSSITAASETAKFSCTGQPSMPSGWKQGEAKELQWTGCSELVEGENQKIAVAITYYDALSSPAFSNEAKGEVYATVNANFSLGQEDKTSPEEVQSNSSFATKSGDLPNLYNITLQDQNGISLFFMQNAKGKIISGGWTSCLKKATLGPFSIKPNGFPITAYYNDCKDFFKTKIVEIPAPK